MSSNNHSIFANKRIWITGHRGMLGSALMRAMANENAILITASSADLDLRCQAEVNDWVHEHKPELVFHAGAKVGGIHANATYRADFLRDNILIQTNVIDAAYRVGVKKLVFVASNCTYPTKALQPISEDALLTGPLEENIRSYAIAKIAGIEMCRAYKTQFGCDFVSVIPPNLYGPGDNYHPEHNHVIAGIIRRAHEAKVSGDKEFLVWGDGTARREILYIDDLASAMKVLMSQKSEHDIYNVGLGYDFSISELAHLIVKTVGFEGKIVFDTSKPNGTMKKLLNSARINNLGWKPVIDPCKGLELSYSDFKSQLASGNGRL
ncbi:GDP-L-fucose synthase [Methylophilus sp. YYY-1]|uniref:GDP-L-fucose synthase family protein n=1 Tax=Methylophilus sp. YYY-1 TaxID=2682087 RepID=UPI0023B2ACE9|nr:GDP-L-fucose synthase [Methylophilus sp. YYY-1]MDF0377970.1 NAD-dependent epimerase/dehydratase family protein [Methylophilus sp. YYY-1]